MIDLRDAIGFSLVFISFAFPKPIGNFIYKPNKSKDNDESRSGNKCGFR